MNLRNLAIWGVIVVVLIGLYSMMTGGGHAGASGQITRWRPPSTPASPWP